VPVRFNRHLKLIGSSWGSKPFKVLPFATPSALPETHLCFNVGGKIGKIILIYQSIFVQI
jgi:hypothetical protein